MNKEINISHLIDYIVKNISLSAFLETEIGCTLKWSSPQKASCACPIHEERKPSFNIKIMDDGVCVFHCFGCGIGGNIIHFVKEYYSMRNKAEAISYLCKMYNIKDTEDIILQGLKNVYKKVDVQRKMENANILASNQCRMLLRKNFIENKKWVSNAYKRLNRAMEEEDTDEIENIGYEASKLLCENTKTIKE